MSATDQATAADYLEYPPSMVLGGVKHRRADWDNPYLGQVLGAEVLAAMASCGHSWESFRNVATGERKARMTDYCHETHYCGICATSQANERASTWLEHFRAVNEAFRPPVAGFEVTFTVPAELSQKIAIHPNRRAILSALFGAVHATMDRSGLMAWVAVMHAVSSDHPHRPHIHFVVFYPAVDREGRRLAGWLDREAFAERRRGFLNAWNGRLHLVCTGFELGDWESRNLHLSYSKGSGDLACRIRYEMRPPLRDAFIHARDSAEHLQAALDLALVFLYPDGHEGRVRRKKARDGRVMPAEPVMSGKPAFRRIRGGGRFAPRMITPFFEELGFHRAEKDGGQWQTEGKAVLVDEGEDVCTFWIVTTGKVVNVPRRNVSMAGHGCPFEWARGPG